MPYPDSRGLMLLIRRWRLFVALLAAAVLLGTPTAAAVEPGSPTADASAQAPSAQPNRVATLNVYNPGGRKPDAAADVLAKYRPQVVGLQEVCQTDVWKIRDKLTERTGIEYHAKFEYFNHWWHWSHAWRCGEGRLYGIALLSASPLTEFDSHTYDEGGTERRGYVSAKTLVDGVDVRVFNTHLAQAGQSSERRSQVSELVGEASRHDRAIVLGDFNAEPHYGELAGMWTGFTEADPGCGPVYSAACTVTANASPRRKKFDYVWINSAFQPGPGVTAVDTWSDHDLVFSDVNNVL